MPRSVFPALGLATLVLLAGCIGIFESPTPRDPASRNTNGSSASSLQELEGQHLWIDGTVDHVENSTLYLRDNDVVTPILMNEAALLRCRSNGSNLSCRPIELGDVQQGEEVCTNVAVENGTVQGIKVFIDAVCGGPQAPPQ